MKILISTLKLKWLAAASLTTTGGVAAAATRGARVARLFALTRVLLMFVSAMVLLEHPAFAQTDPLDTFGLEVIRVLLRLVGILAVAGGLIIASRLIGGASLGGSRVVGESVMAGAAVLGGIAFAIYMPTIVGNLIASIGAGGFQMPQMPVP